MKKTIAVLGLVACAGRGVVEEDSVQVTTQADASDASPDTGGLSTADGTRLRGNYYVGSDGSKQFVNWHDTQLNFDCSFLPASDGSFRCFPTISLHSYGFFSDNQCTHPLMFVGNGCVTPSFSVWATTTACGQTSYHVLPIIEQVPINSLGYIPTGFAYHLLQGECVSDPTGTASNGDSVFTTGAEIPPGQYAAATIQTL